MVGESPGEGEDQSGRPFQGAAGQFLNQLFEWYLHQVGVKRDQVLITNLVKCRPPDNDFDIAREHHAHTICPSLWLEKEIELAFPEIIVALGATATRYLLADYRFSMDSDHGLPRLIDRADLPVDAIDAPGSQMIVFPIYHPAAGFHDTRNLRNTMSDFKSLANLISLLDSGLTQQQAIKEIIPQDQHKNQEQYQIVTTIEHALQLLSQPFYAIDTETIPTPEGQKLWSIQVSSQPGTAFFIPANLVPDPQTAIPSTSLVLVHNWLYDQQFINIPNFIDTMIAAYLIQYPLGLKDLAWRLCGMEMHDYNEYTRPYRRQKALSYLRKASRTDWGPPIKLEPRWEWDNKQKGLIQKHKRPTKLNGKILDKMSKSLDDPDYDPYIKWRDVDPREKVLLERAMGPMLDASLEDAPFDDAMFYSCRDPDATVRIWPILKLEIEKLGLSNLLYNIDLPTLEFAREMMDEGMQVSEPQLRALSEKCIDRMKETVSDMVTALEHAKVNEQLDYTQILPFIGVDGLDFRFNPNSADQTAKKVLGWNGIGTQPVTKERELKLTNHPAVPFIIDYRQTAKIRDSYAEKLIPYIDSNSRVHCDVFPAGTETGRYRMRNPPLQTIPTRTDLGAEVRNAFGSRDGYQILCIDYSQIEIRTLADISGCQNLIILFQNNGDAHTNMASHVFGVSEETVLSDERHYRYPIKRLHFGIVYGITAEGLYVAMIEEGITDWDRHQCQEIIDSYYQVNPEVKVYTLSQFQHARQYGYVRDPYFGRIRHIPEIYIPVKRIASEGERMAANMPITSSAQGIIKLATIRIRKWRSNIWNPLHPDLPIYMINQVHDEIIFEVPTQYVLEIAYCCKFIMEQVGIDLVKVDGSVGMSVPIVAECKAGESWGEAKKLEMLT